MIDTVLEARGLCKNFGALKALSDVSIDLKKGEIHAVIGPNGAGKSTLIAALCGTLQSDSGKVRLLDRDVSRDSAVQRAGAGLARTFQVSALAMDDTVLQNVLLGALGRSGHPWKFFRSALGNAELRTRAEAALSRVDLLGSAHKRVFELSHGQRRQLEVAIALTLEPVLFVMDEPMAGLGIEGSSLMTGFLSDLRTEAPILLVEHDMDAVFQLADRISVLVYGELVATGTVAQIRANREVRQAYLGEDA